MDWWVGKLTADAEREIFQPRMDTDGHGWTRIKKQKRLTRMARIFQDDFPLWVLAFRRDVSAVAVAKHANCHFSRTDPF